MFPLPAAVAALLLLGLTRRWAEARDRQQVLAARLAELDSDEPYDPWPSDVSPADRGTVAAGL